MKKISALLIIFLMGILPLRADVKNHHSPRKAFLLSTFIPGGGQIYNQKKWKSLVISTVETTCFSLVVYNSLKYRHLGQDKYLERRSSFLLCGIATGLYSMVDAYIDAHFFDFENQYTRLQIEQGEIKFSFCFALP